MGEIKQSVKVGGIRVLALLDSGATENFISLKLAKKLKLPLLKKYEFKGIDGIKNIGRISGVYLFIKGRGSSNSIVVTDILPQDGYHIILGQRFLQDNDVILDFKKDKFELGTHHQKMRKIGRI